MAYNHKEYMKEYRQRSEVKAKKAETDRRYREKYKEELKIRRKIYDKTYRDKNIEKIKISAATFKLNNPEKVKATKRRWKQRNLDNGRVNTAKRRAVKLNATYSESSELNIFITKEAYHLSKIREAATNIRWHVDHIIPLVNDRVCGLHVGINLQVIPAYINLVKGNTFKIS
jgi:hypothetical protein